MTGVSLRKNHWFRSQGWGFQLDSHARGHHGFEGAHGVAGGAGAAAHWRLTGHQHDVVEWAQGLGGGGRGGRVLHLLQGVQHYIRGVFGCALAFQLPQLIQGCVHRLLDILP